MKTLTLVAFGVFALMLLAEASEGFLLKKSSKKDMKQEKKGCKAKKGCSHRGRVRMPARHMKHISHATHHMPDFHRGGEVEIHEMDMSHVGDFMHMIQRHDMMHPMVRPMMMMPVPMTMMPSMARQVMMSPTGQVMMSPGLATAVTMNNHNNMHRHQPAMTMASVRQMMIRNMMRSMMQDTDSMRMARPSMAGTTTTMMSPMSMQMAMPSQRVSSIAVAPRSVKVRFPMSPPPPSIMTAGRAVEQEQERRPSLSTLV